MARTEVGEQYFSNFRIAVQQPDANRIPSYIKPETVEVKVDGPRKIMVVGGPRGIDINI